jgi:hypothetical protein
LGRLPRLSEAVDVHPLVFVWAGIAVGLAGVPVWARLVWGAVEEVVMIRRKAMDRE